MTLETDLASYDAMFAAWLAQNPGGTFSRFSVQKMQASIAKGRPHTTLGPTLTINEEWRRAGEPGLASVLSAVDLGSGMKVCDYGCGSLRVGIHLIERQSRGCYFGLDVTEDFIAIGRELVGYDLLEAKQPVLGSISDMIPAAIAADIDVLFNLNVASHVHPDEWDAFISNILAICHKSGSKVVIHAMIGGANQRFQRSGWARTVRQYIDALAPMTLGRVAEREKLERNGIPLSSQMLTFSRK